MHARRFAISIFCLVTTALAGCGVKEKPAAEAASGPGHPLASMDVFYNTETKTLRFGARLGRSDTWAGVAADDQFFADGVPLPRLTVDPPGDVVSYELQRSPVEPAAVIPFAFEYRTPQRTVTADAALRAVAVETLPETARLADGFRVAWTGEPLADTEELWIAIRAVGTTRSWQYTRQDALVIDDHGVTIPPDLAPSGYPLDQPRPGTGNYELLIARTSWTEQRPDAISVHSFAAYNSAWTPLTLTP